MMPFSVSLVVFLLCFRLRLDLRASRSVKSTSLVTESNYKNDNINMSNEDNNHDTNYINKYTDANHDTRKLLL